jgi:hypothetical protein
LLVGLQLRLQKLERVALVLVLDLLLNFRDLILYLFLLPFSYLI